MTVFPNWKQYAVSQKRPRTGFIPTGFEFLVRASQCGGVDFTTFQDEFDLEFLGSDKNNFRTVPGAITAKYPSVVFTINKFAKGSGNDKLAVIESYLSKQHPILVSLTLNQHGGWHIMPVVDADDSTVILLNHIDEDNNPILRHVTKEEIVRIHDEWPGGDDVAYIP